MSTTVVVGDGEMYHLECAGKHDEADEIEINEEWDEYPGDGYCDDGTPHSCGACNGYLVEDSRVTESTLARDILNLTVEARRYAATHTASLLAHVARQFDRQPDRLIDEMTMAITNRPAGTPHDSEIGAQAFTLAYEWIEQYAHRTILHVRNAHPGKIGRQYYTDTDGNEYTELDSRGYLKEGFEDMPCAACGCACGSDCLSDEMGDQWCPDCVEVED